PHIDKIRGLGDNEWLELGQPAADPKWGRARGRSWNAAMPPAPELRGAFLFGEGVHGYVKPDGRYMDDLWLYDVNGHRWVCCYPGADTKSLRLAIDKDGFESAGGRPLPVASQAHRYSINTYDTHRRRFLRLPTLQDHWRPAPPRRKRWLKPAPADAGPWFFDPATGRWGRVRTGTRAPRSGYGDTFLYLPDRRQAFFAHGSQE